MLPQPAPSLPASDAALSGGARLLQGQYQIEQPLIAGGFGITYLARDSLDRRVVIKECFPAEVCERDGTQVRPRGPAQLRIYKTVLRNFLREAHLLARAVHPNIVPVHQVFRENGTGYIAMDFVDGLDLLALQETQGHRLTAEMRQACLTQALGALAALHDQGILHRDISPDNLIWTRDNRLMLIDFGAACTVCPEEQAASEGAMAVKDGYSPHELYERGAIARPSSDLYALGATMVFLLTGEAPAAGPDRLAAVARGDMDPLMHLLPDNRPDAALWHSVAKALSVLPGARYQSAADWLADLRATGTVASAPPAPVAETKAEPGPLQDTPVVPEAQASTPQAPERQPPEEQPPAASADAAPPLDLRIAALVAETNDTITAGLPRTLRPEPDSSPAPTQSPGNGQFVDIFGQPVSDLQAWLADQDSPRARGPRKPAEGSATGNNRNAPAASAPRQEQDTPAKRGLGRLFAPRSAAPKTATTP
ncbi:serine/threonine protein kinase [Tritonibacter horizontis]|uniref:Serine/threonine-protein kinase StkP n=1 Tax=Tritonibacter horizontis TaxID=1768241 RepID=A0A132C0B3_9RHOB|nr:serine/threonine-protein kinase [Tritonibacter horizontis]KUP94024.1 serine/threonine-protein kinase StkP [Tritonibacter horizontis]